MADSERGVIRNRGYATQIRDFSGLRFGNITPTDVDGLIEYKGKGYVLIEIKYQGVQLPPGQRLALERLCDDLQRTKPTLLIIAVHDSDGDIDVAKTLVAEYRFKRKWRTRDGTIRELIRAFLGHLDAPW